MAVTIEEIARRAGVSAGTVSRILNGKNKENRPTIAKRADRIRRLAAEMGYRPNAAARSMITGRFGMVALLTCGDLGFDFFAASLMHGIHHGLEVRDTRLILNEINGNLLANPDFVPRLFQESAVDGVLVNIDSKLPTTAIPYFESQPMPTVLLNRKHAKRSVYPDEIMGARLATEYLLKNGRSELGYFKLSTSIPELHYSVQDRYIGFCQAMDSAGLSAHRVIQGHSEDPGYPHKMGNSVPKALSFLDQFPDINGIVCYSLIDAVVMHTAATQRGMRLGEDLDMIVFHEREAHSNIGIPIHTMLVPFGQVGIEAVNLIMASQKNGQEEARGALVVPYTDMFNATDQTVQPVAAIS